MKTNKYNNIYILLFWLFTVSNINAQTLTLDTVIKDTQAISVEIYQLEQQVRLWNARLAASKVLIACKSKNIDCQNTHKLSKNLLKQEIQTSDNKNNKSTKTIYKQKQIAPKLESIYSKSVQLSSNNPQYSYSGYFMLGEMTPDGWLIQEIGVDGVDFEHSSSGIKKNIQLFWNK